MFKKLKPKDLSVVLLTITLCIILVVSTVGSVFFEKDNDGRTEELIAFLLGSITTIVGEYILLNLKLGKKDEDD
jgi:hypothetical protein